MVSTECQTCQLEDLPRIWGHVDLFPSMEKSEFMEFLGLFFCRANSQ